MTPINFTQNSIQQIRRDLADKKCTPTQVAKACIDAYEKLDPEFHAFESFDQEALLRQVKACEMRLQNAQNLRPLEAIPVAVKDNINTVDFNTQMGSQIWHDFAPGNDARVVDYLKWNGAVIAGKTVTAEFAVHALNKTLNPFDKTHTPGTSSSGSAVAVSCGITPCALGTQTAGSIIRPASYNGVYGFKPSYGLIPRTGILKSTDTLDSVGFYTYFAEDLPIILNSAKVKGHNYPIIEREFARGQEKILTLPKGFKVGVINVDHLIEPEDYAATQFSNWVDQLSSDENIQVQSVTLPQIFQEGFETHRILYHKCLSYYFKREYTQHTLISKEMNSCIEDGLLVSSADYQMALKQQAQFAKELDEIFSQFDVLVSLSTTGAAPLRHEKEKRDLCLLWTMGYIPAVNIPLFKNLAGLPFGAQIVSKKYYDLYLLSIIDYLVSKGLAPEASMLNAHIGHSAQSTVGLSQ